MNQVINRVVMQPMQWAPIPDVHEIEPLSDKDADCLRAIRDVLLRHDAVDRFAVSLVHKHFDLATSEQMVEFTDPEARTLTIKPLAADHGLKMLETTWKFSRDTDAANPLTICVYRCFFNPNSTPQHAGQHCAG